MSRATSPPPEKDSIRESSDAIIVDDHWTDDIGAREVCANCGELREGTFCPHCGQQHLRHRLKFGELLKGLLSRITNLEKGLFHTFFLLLRHPGSVPKDYIQGRQKPYVNPLAYFFLGAAIQLISLYITKPVIFPTMRDQLATSFNQQDENILKNADKMFDGDAASAFAECYFAAMQQGYTYAALIFFCFPFAFMLMSLHRVTGEDFRLGEMMVFSLFVFAQMLVLTAVLTPIAIRISPALQATVAMGTYFVYPQLAHSGFFQRTWLSRLMTLISTALATVTFFASIMGIFIVSLIVTIIMKVNGW